MKNTRTKQKILDHLMLGLSNKEIARATGLCLPTIKNHVSSLFETYNVTSRYRLMASVYGAERTRKNEEEQR